MSFLRTPFANERVNGFQTLLKSVRHDYYPLFSSICGKLSCKKSALVWCESLRLFVKTLTADENYSRQQYVEFTATISNAVISEKKDFFWFLIAILKCAQNLEHFQKKNEYPSLIISGIIDAERRGYLNV